MKAHAMEWDSEVEHNPDEDILVYGIHGNEGVVFLSLEGAEEYVYENYQSEYRCKDEFIELCESIIWEERRHDYATQMGWI